MYSNGCTLYKRTKNQPIEKQKKMKTENDDICDSLFTHSNGLSNSILKSN